jgi:hypothetical protein
MRLSCTLIDLVLGQLHIRDSLHCAGWKGAPTPDREICPDRHRFLETPGNFGQGGEEQIAKGMSIQAIGSAKAVTE